MDYMREIAEEVFPWFVHDSDGQASVSRGDARRLQFVSDVQARLRHRTLWNEGSEQTRVELLADLLYGDTAAPLGSTLAQRAVDISEHYPELIRALADVNAKKARTSKEDAKRQSAIVASHFLAHPAWVRGTLDRLSTLRYRHVPSEAYPFEIVLERELDLITRSREFRMKSDPEARISRLRQELSELKSELAALAPAAQSREEACRAGKRARDIWDLIEPLKEELFILNQRTSDRSTTSPVSRSDNELLHGPYSPSKRTEEPPPRYALRRALGLNLFGVAFSGGGIRSATFNLGVLQGLADLDLLRRVDYLSTVSGGGYIGGWLAGCVKSARNGIRDVQRWLSLTRSPDPEMPERLPLRFLREYSNYLTPRVGLMSADTWTMVAIWIRNTLLNQLVLALFLGALVLAPLALGSVAIELEQHRWSAVIVYALAGVLILRGTVWTGRNIRAFDEGWRKHQSNEQGGPNDRPPWPGWATQGTIQGTIVGPYLLSFFLLAQPLAKFATSGETARYVWTAGAVQFLLLIIVQIVGRFGTFFYAENPLPGEIRLRLEEWGVRGERIVAAITRVKATLGILVSSIVASAAGAGLLYLLPTSLAKLHWYDRASYLGKWQVITFGPSLILLVLSVTVTIHIGLLGTSFPDARREWWSRLGAWTLVYALGWVGLCLVAFFGPIWFFDGRAQLAAGATWLGATIAGVLTGKSAKTGSATSLTKFGGWRNVIAVIAPYVFVVGLLVLVATGTHELFDWIRPPSSAPPRELLPAHTWNGYWAHFAGAPWWLAGVVCIALALLSFGLAMRVDINEFSMHHFYRNRLVRCYLGASQREGERSASPFTGFDADDDIELTSLENGNLLKHDNERLRDGEDVVVVPEKPYLGPYPIFNATLNVVRGSDLAAQERKAESFILSPLFSGFNRRQREAVDKDTIEDKLATAAYRPTKYWGSSENRGMTLGTAMAISGAAANPNMGYHSSAAVGFLMAAFNARLGWWIGNPRHVTTWRHARPGSGLFYHIAELTGNTNDRARYVNLSDGGHFENLGLYELVRRRCKFIIVCDSEEDASYKFGGLGSAVRKCRADFGTDIDINIDQLRPVAKDGTTRSRVHCVVGSIQYPGGQPGTLLYIKSTLSGDEPADVAEYARREPAFPHQSTADQWFDESQFESYRALGRHVAKVVLGRAVQVPAADDVDGALTNRVFDRLRDAWYPPSAAITEHFVEHTRRYDELLERLRKDRRLSRFDEVLFPDVETFFTSSTNADDGPPATGDASSQPGDRKVLARMFGGEREDGEDGGALLTTANTPRTDNRNEFYTYQIMIELMQSVYIDLDLEENAEHPHNAGWMRIFHQWAADGHFKRAWLVSKHTYSKKFQHFCVTQFDLPS